MQGGNGLQRMQAEMARQCADALATIDGVGEAAAEAARSARATPSLLLCGMGGSHHVNAIAEPLYRALGLDCRAENASALLTSPLPPARRTALIASQSGRSGEIVQLVGRQAGAEDRFALTLDGESPLAKACRAALVAHGGPEQAFAATRSILLTLAMHGAILEALGAPQAAFRAILADFRPPSVEAADHALAACDSVVFAGYGAMSGVATSAALSLMELARIPAIGFEGGQFRHGPYEALRPGLGVVLLRSAGADAGLVPPLAEAALQAGCPVLVLDASGTAPVAGCSSLPLPAGEGLAAAAAMLLALQPLNIAMARRRVPGDVGSPLRTSKVTL